MDETGVQTVAEPPVVIAPKGRTAHCITSFERGTTSTIIYAVNAVGDVVLPIVILKGKAVGTDWLNGAPFGAKVCVSKNGWVNKDLITEFGNQLLRFLECKNLIDGRPHILLMDNHYSHSFNFEFLENMRRNNIHVFSLPTHTSHILQPLDKCPLGVFKRSWASELRKFHQSVGGRRLDYNEFFLVFSPAWSAAMTTSTCQSGFRISCLFPINMNAIPE